MQGVKGSERENGAGVDQPVWAREEAFPPAGEGFGWIDRKGGRHVSASVDELSQTIRGDRDSVVNLVWSPESAYCKIPEEVEAFEESISEIRKRWVNDDLLDARHRLKWFGFGLGALVAYMVFQSWKQLGLLQQANGLDLGVVQELKWILKALIGSTSVGISLLGFLIFAFIPWYQAEKRLRELKQSQDSGNSRRIIPLIRFETWLQGQKAPVTKLILVMIAIVALAQVFFKGSVADAGLVKAAYLNGERWRLFTAPMLHGGILHFVMNALGLLYLGKRLEVFARWPHLPMVFLFSALVGGEASARFTQGTSVGASGGLMGWLGFLLVFETLHSKLIPQSAKRRLIGGVVMTGLIGLVGYRFIDNAAHFGGLFAGMAYAAIVFPKSSSVLRPKMNITDRLLGGASLGVIALSGGFAIMKMME
ncbi:MAG: rhomboid family intramembrane serine protease [Armatimonadetes bacterium]|nr:rhomboid family intramembrane serine protease [Akkermansiaceae bacterium]